MYGSATSAPVKVSPQSELMGLRSAGFALAPDILLRTVSPDRCCNWRAHRGVALQHAFVGRWLLLERWRALQRGTDASQLMTWGSSAPSWRQCKCAGRRRSRMVRGGANWRTYRGVALHYAFVGRWFSLERLKALQRGANAPRLMAWRRRDARTSLFTVKFTVQT